jgi:hypothetical protein
LSLLALELLNLKLHGGNLLSGRTICNGGKCGARVSTTEHFLLSSSALQRVLLLLYFLLPELCAECEHHSPDVLLQLLFEVSDSGLDGHAIR